jgi:hypothetical protein
MAVPAFLLRNSHGALLSAQTGGKDMEGMCKMNDWLKSWVKTSQGCELKRKQTPQPGILADALHG